MLQHMISKLGPKDASALSGDVVRALILDFGLHGGMLDWLIAGKTPCYN